MVKPYDTGVWRIDCDMFLHENDFNLFGLCRVHFFGSVLPQRSIYLGHSIFYSFLKFVT